MSLSSQACNWIVLANLMLGVTLRWTSIHSEGVEIPQSLHNRRKALIYVCRLHLETLFSSPAAERFDGLVILLCALFTLNILDSRWPHMVSWV